MNWDELNAFVTVADSSSFSRAGELLHLTQPAVSKRISNLESTLDVSLFDRVGRQVHLTEAGRILIPRAREILRSVSDAENLIRNTRGEVAGDLRVATSHHVGLHRLAPVLKDFKRSYPHVRLDIRFEDSEAAHTLVRSADTELAVVTLDPTGPKGLAYDTLWNDPLVFVVSKNDPLTQHSRIDIATLAAQPAILPGLATYTGRIVRTRFHEAGFDLRPEMETNYLETIGMLVGIGLGWSVLPETMVTHEIAAIPVTTEPLQRVLGAVTNPRRTRSNAATAFMAVLDRHRG